MASGLVIKPRGSNHKVSRRLARKIERRTVRKWECLRNSRRSGLLVAVLGCSSLPGTAALASYLGIW
jgi:hypothetical protein